jgi:hypothetical protein
MSWNHRIMRRAYKCPHGEPEYEYGVYEVYYNEAGEPSSWSDEPRTACADDMDGMKWVLEKQLEALGKPVLDYDNKGNPL